MSQKGQKPAGKKPGGAKSGKDGALPPVGTFKLGEYPKHCGPTWE